MRISHPRRQQHPSAPAPEVSTWDRAFFPATIGLLALFVLLAWLAAPPGIESRQDDAIYVFLARSLLEFGYHDLYRADSPVHNMYPPGYPAALAVLVGIFGERFLLIRGFGIAVMAAGLGAATVTVRRLWSAQLALLSLAVLVVNPHLVGAAGEIGTDSLYVLTSVLALSLLSRSQASSRLLFAAGALAIFASLTRSVGVTLLVAIWVFWLMERRYGRALYFAVASAATTGMWLLWTIVSPEKYVGRSYIADATYAGDYSGESFGSVLLGRIGTNIPIYLGDFLPNRIGIPQLPGPLQLAAAAGTAVALAVGLVVLWRHWRITVLYLLAYAALLALWPWSLGRFLNVLIPLLVPAVLLGTGGVVSRIDRRAVVPAVAALGLLLVIAGCLRSEKLIGGARACTWGFELPAADCRQGDSGAFYNALEHINEAAPADAILLSSKPAPAHFFTDRRTVTFFGAMSQEPDGLLPFLRASGSRYIILSRMHIADRSMLLPLLTANCSSLHLDAAFESYTYVFYVLDSQLTAADDAACRALSDYASSPPAPFEQ